MRPVLFSLRFGSRELGVHSYGLLIAAGLGVGIWVAHREARRRGLDGGRVLDLAFWVTVAGLVGSRLVYGLVNLRAFAHLCAAGAEGESARTPGEWLSDCTRILHVWEGGLVFYGGVAGAVIVALVFARRQRWSFWMVGDVFAPALAVGHALGRLGCFAAGCCFGKAWASAAPPAWSAAFPRGSVAFDELASAGAVPPGASLTAPLHPTQLYESGGELALFGLLLWLRPRLRDRPGALLLTYAALYALLRFVVEIFRGDFARLYLLSIPVPRLAAWLRLPAAEPLFLSVGQLTSVAILAATAAAFVARRRSWARLIPPPGPASES
jgi:phosphatidylglycerol:prolipoprotein diacylglycerol transferase